MKKNPQQNRLSGQTQATKLNGLIETQNLVLAPDIKIDSVNIRQNIAEILMIMDKIMLVGDTPHLQFRIIFLQGSGACFEFLRQNDFVIINHDIIAHGAGDIRIFQGKPAEIFRIFLVRSIRHILHSGAAVRIDLADHSFILAVNAEHLFRGGTVNIYHIFSIEIIRASDQGVLRHRSSPCRSGTAPDPEIISAQFDKSGGVKFRRGGKNFQDNFIESRIFRFDFSDPFHIERSDQRIILNVSRRTRRRGCRTKNSSPFPDFLLFFIQPFCRQTQFMKLVPRRCKFYHIHFPLLSVNTLYLIYSA